MLVSICLPVFNGEQYLADAVSSALNQTHEQIELLISDDQSTDGSWEIIQKFCARDQRIKICRNESRRGLFENYNSTMRGANGDFIKLFAQDDLLAPNAVSAMLKGIEENASVSIVACGKNILAEAPPQSARRQSNKNRIADGADEHALLEVVDPSPDSNVDKHESGLTSGFNPGKLVLLKCLRQYRNLVGEPVAVMLRRSLVDTGFATDYRSLGDMEFWFRMLEKGDLYYIPEKLVTFRQHPESRTSHLLQDLDWLLDFPKLSKQYRQYLDDLGIDRSAYCSRFLELAAPLVRDHASEDKAFIESLPPYKELAYYLLKRLPAALDGEANYNSVLNSTSWKVTKPLRLLKGKLEK